MNKRTKDLVDAAVQLPPAERLDLIEQLVSSLDKLNPSIAQAWADEAERRLDAYLDGTIAARDAKDVMAKNLKS